MGDLRSTFPPSEISALSRFPERRAENAFPCITQHDSRGLYIDISDLNSASILNYHGASAALVGRMGETGPFGESDRILRSLRGRPVSSDTAAALVTSIPFRVAGRSGSPAVWGQVVGAVGIGAVAGIDALAFADRALWRGIDLE